MTGAASSPFVGWGCLILWGCWFLFFKELLFSFKFLGHFCSMQLPLTILLLFASNTFMTFAWYGHLKFKDLSLGKAILCSWGLAFFEYCLMVPANRLGFQILSAYQLKILQECVTLTVFVAFAYFVLKEPPRAKYLLAFGFVLAAVFIAMRPD